MRVWDLFVVSVWFGLDSIAVLVFVDILIEFDKYCPNNYSATVRLGALSSLVWFGCWSFPVCCFGV